MLLYRPKLQADENVCSLMQAVLKKKIVTLFSAGFAGLCSEPGPAGRLVTVQPSAAAQGPALPALVFPGLFPT